MPLPTPKADEAEADFVSRFMGDKEANATFPDQKQRSAVAYEKWKNRNKTVAALRAPIAYSQPNEVEVDEINGIIRNVALMTIGPARGHGFDIDETTIRQLCELINADPSGAGVKSRATHPNVSDDGNVADDLMQLVGRVRNARIVGNAARGDVYLGDYAKKVPGLGDVWSYLCSLAKNDPTALGMSAMFSFDVDPQLDASGQPASMPARITNLVGVDFVGKPAANPNGLLSQPANAPPPAPSPTAITQPKTKGYPMDAELKAMLVGYGMKSDASDEEANEFLSKLSEDKRAELQAKLNTMNPAGKCAASARDAGFTVGLNWKAPVPGTRDTADLGENVVGMEERRTGLIAKLGQTLKVDELTTARCIAEGLTIEQSRTAMLRSLAEAIAKGKVPRDPVTDPRYTVGTSIHVGDDNNISSLRDTLVDAISMKMLARQYDPDTASDKYQAALKAVNRRGEPMFTMIGDGRTKQFASLSMSRMCQHYLATLGMKNAFLLTENQVPEYLSIRFLRQQRHTQVAALAESVGDFSSITLDAFNKTLRVAYLDALRTWQIWARRATAPDFKNINRVVLSESPNMVSRNQGGEIKYVQLTDSKETYTLSEYVAGIRLTRRAIINDDLDAFARIPLIQANAAGRLEDDVAYAVLMGGLTTTMADTGAIFNSTAVTTAGGHANYTSSGTALSVASLQVAKRAIKAQKGLANAARLELNPKFLLVPISIEETADQLIGSPILIPGIAGGGTSGTPAAGTISQGAKNPFYGKLTVIGSSRLDDTSLTGGSTTSWYMMADYRDGQIDTVEVCFLQDEPEPVARQETDFDTEDVKFAIRHTVAAKAIDWRGLYKNAGA